MIKENMELIRSILLSKCYGEDMDGAADAEMAEQYEVLRTSGLMEGNSVTQKGREFAELIRERVMWAKIQVMFSAYSVPMTIDSVRGVAERVMEYRRL